MNTITATVDGQALTIELHRITGADAIDYRNVVAEDLDYRVGVLIGLGAAGEEPTLADAAVAKWLWYRQNIDHRAPLAAVARTVTLLPAPADEAGATSARPEAD